MAEQIEEKVPVPPQSQEETMSKRDRFKKRLSEKYPDKNFDDDEDLFGQVSDDYDESDKKLSQYKDEEDKLIGMFNKDPRVGSLFSELANGGDPRMVLLRLFGKDAIEMMDDPEQQELAAKANKEYLERVAQEKNLEEQYQQNLDKSLQIADEWQKKHGLSDEEVDKTFEVLINLGSDAIVGKFSEESLDMARKAITHDSDVEMAGQKGEVKGRNERIDMKLKKKKSGDGIPSLAGKSRSASEKSSPSLGALDTISNRGSIWDSEEKRTKYN